jgi:hypothetical protein
MRFTFTLTTKSTPDQVFRAFTDFTDRRAGVWSRTLHTEKYEVRGLGDGWAVVKEGSPGTWVLLRYEWPSADRVHWSVIDTSYCRRGTGDIAIRPAAGGGSVLRCEFHHRDGEGLTGNAVLILQRLMGPIFFPRLWKAAWTGRQPRRARVDAEQARRGRQAPGIRCASWLDEAAHHRVDDPGWAPSRR